MIRYSCPKCDTSLKSADDKAGTKTTCPRCGEKLEVPAASDDKKPTAGKSTKDVIAESALTMDFNPKEKAHGEMTFKIPKAGS